MGIQKRRSPNPEERRRVLCDAAIQLLADEGAKGVDHRQGQATQDAE